MSIYSADREKIDLKLVELVKPHDVLYNGSTSTSANYVEARNELWNDICMEMNKTFSLNRYVDEWKTRWLALRSSYRQGIQTKVNRRSTVCNEMDFLRPYTHVSKAGRKKHKKVTKINEYIPKNKVSVTMKREKLHRQTAHTNGYENNAMAYLDSGYQPIVKREAIDDERFEIIVPDDDDTGLNDELSENTENPLSRNAFDEEIEDSDSAFGVLITRELREMEPAAKREFKRTVTQLLYS